LAKYHDIYPNFEMNGRLIEEGFLVQNPLHGA